MKILFIGGTGIISSATSQLAVKKGIELFHFNRGKRSQFFTRGVEQITGDITNFSEMETLLQNYNFDVVVDWLAFTPTDIERDIKLFSGKIKQFVFISSASIYQKPSHNYLITEDTPVENPYWKYARDKIACENRLHEEYRKNNFPITIVRPSFTYNITQVPAIVSNNKMPMTLIERMRKGKEIIVPGDGSSLWVMTHNTDFAKGLVGLLGNAKAVGEIFHITSDEVLSWDRIIKTIGEVINIEPKIIHIPSDFINAYAPNIGIGLLGDKSTSVVFDNSKIKKFVPEFKCTVSYKEGITYSLQWLEGHQSYCKVDEANDKVMEMIIEKHRIALP